jgi:hypothetical protein
MRRFLMRLRSMVLLLGAALHLTSPGCMARKLATQRGEAYAVRFSSPWTALGANNKRFVITLPHVYEIRKEPSAPWNELLFALKGSGQSLSEERFMVKFGKELKTQPATKEAWERATTVSTGNSYFGEGSSQLFPALQGDESKSEYWFQGRGYKRTGDWWSKVMLSPDKRLLTALTYTSPEKPERGHLIFGGGEPRRGEFFWDVYETGSDAKMASGSLTFSEIAPGVISDTALWVDEKYLLLPLDEGAQSCLLIALPEN